MKEILVHAIVASIFSVVMAFTWWMIFPVEILRATFGQWFSMCLLLLFTAETLKGWLKC